MFAICWRVTSRGSSHGISSVPYWRNGNRFRHGRSQGAVPHHPPSAAIRQRCPELSGEERRDKRGKSACRRRPSALVGRSNPARQDEARTASRISHAGWARAQRQPNSRPTNRPIPPHQRRCVERLLPDKSTHFAGHFIEGMATI
jgi:hypothetical protein